MGMGTGGTEQSVDREGETERKPFLEGKHIPEIRRMQGKAAFGTTKGTGGRRNGKSVQGALNEEEIRGMEKMKLAK